MDKYYSVIHVVVYKKTVGLRSVLHLFFSIYVSETIKYFLGSYISIPSTLYGGLRDSQGRSGNNVSCQYARSLHASLRWNFGGLQRAPLASHKSQRGLSCPKWRYGDRQLVFGASALPDSLSYLYTPRAHGGNRRTQLDHSFLFESLPKVCDVFITFTGCLTIMEKGF